MTPLGSSFAALAALSSLASLQAAEPAHNAAVAAQPPALFQKYCIECHGDAKEKGEVNLQKLLGQRSVGEHWEAWDKVAEMLETKQMPPDDAEEQPSETDRQAAATWIRSALKAHEAAHAGEPGRVTVRRLTSGEYAYAVRDLTGIDLKVGIDASSDSVGGEGFTNFGDVQFVQDASIERYLEAAKLVASHAVIGAGPLEFYTDPGRTGLELSALNRINRLYDTKGFRVVSGEGGRPFGLDRYGKAFYVAWYYKHRAALGDPQANLRDLAAKEGITGRFADHIWEVVNRTDLRFPSSEMVARWQALPTPTADVAASLQAGRAGTDDLYKYLTTWPSWFFSRGDLAAGGAGDESPLAFNDETLRVQPNRAYTYNPGAPGRGGRGAARPTLGPWTIHLGHTNLNPSPGVKPVVIWRNPRIVTRAAAAPGGGRGGRGAVAQGNAAPATAIVAGTNVSATAAAAPAIPAVTADPQPAAASAGAANAAGGGGRGRGRGGAGPILSTQPLRAVLPPEVALAFGFGTSPDGSKMGPDDFAATGTVTFVMAEPEPGTTVEFQADAELGADRNAVVRLVVADRPPEQARDAQQRVVLGDAGSEGYKAYRAGMAEYASLLPPNSHGEANPADKDPVPEPFDNTYNSPEHDAFILKVKYQRSDQFFTDNLVDGADRDRLNHAWNDLFGSWPYHDAYLEMLVEHYGLKLKSRLMRDLTPEEIAQQPEPARPHLAKLREHYYEVRQAQAAGQPGHLANALEFASRAWRRPLTASEKTRLTAFYERSRKEHALDHDDAVRALLARILVSPEFLYRVETAPGTAQVSNSRPAERPLNDWEMASRLSFFLWSSVPDDELRRAAAAGELTKPDLLAQQVRRMTADPKARRLSTEFFGQWLGFYHFDQFRGVDTGRFPEFTDEVRSAMYDEAVTTFEYLVREGRPLREMLHADYTFLNQPLARFYGLELDLKSGGAVEKVEGSGAFNRGGALRLGSVLTTTSAPLRTSPVKRGDWLLRRILGTPTPPPPPDAGSLPSDPKEFGAMTLRQRLDEHKRNTTCANCHLRIDPLGFPLEGFDAVGRVRQTYDDGAAVDVTGEFGDKSTIVGASGLLGYLQGKEPQVMKTFAKKMVGYALGRTVAASDRGLLDELTASGGSATFTDLAVKIVTSRQFRNRQDDGPAAKSLAAGELPAMGGSGQ